MGRRALKTNPPSCEWREDYEGNWQSACGETWTLIDGTPQKNGMRYCTGCGRVLKERRYEDGGER